MDRSNEAGIMHNRYDSDPSGDGEPTLLDTNHTLTTTGPYVSILPWDYRSAKLQSDVGFF